MPILSALSRSWFTKVCAPVSMLAGMRSLPVVTEAVSGGHIDLWNGLLEQFGRLTSFGGRLAQIRATQACDPARWAWSPAEELS